MLEDGKIIIEIYKEKKNEELSKLIADSASRVETGSVSAISAAYATALAQRAVAAADGENERVNYIARNLEILRGYMVNLIDEDVKCRGPLRKALKEGGEREIEVCRHPACAINEEVINMMTKLLDFDEEIIELVPDTAKHFVGESVSIAMSAINMSRIYVLNMVKPCKDETYKFVTHRENEITLNTCRETAERILAKVEEAIK